MSPKSNNSSNNNGPPTSCLPGSDINVEEFKITKELCDKVMALHNSSFDTNKVDFEEHVPFNSSCYPGGSNASFYIQPFSLPPRNRTHVRKYQKKKGSCSCRTKPNKLNLIMSLPDVRLHSIHHLVKYDRDQSCADKSSAGSNHSSINKHHTVCHLNPIIATRRSDAKIKKKRGGVVNSASAFALLPAKSISKSKLHSQ